MQNITKGQLRVFTYDHIYTFPAPGSKEEAENEMPELKAELRVVNDVFWVRLCTMSDLGFAEAYMYGDVECDDLVSVFMVSPCRFHGRQSSPAPPCVMLATICAPILPACPSGLVIYCCIRVALQMFIYNRENLASMTSRASYLFSIPQKLTSYRFVNTIGNSRSNISAHYDISNEMFMGMFSVSPT